MPPKAKTESTELQVFNLDNLNPALLPELATFKEIQLKVVAENPFVAIVDVASRELAKKHRTARVSARTALQSQDKLISSKFNEAKTKAKSYIGELIDITLPGELEQQNEINRDEAVLEAKRQEKALAEQKRIDAIKKEIEDYVADWKNIITLMDFNSIDEISNSFLESYKSFDTSILEEFEALFPTKIEELAQYLSDKTVSLTNAENARLENIRLEQEAAELRAEKARLEALAKIAEEAEAKAKKEREDFEAEKLAFQLEVARKLSEQDAEIKAKQKLLDDALDGKNISETINLKAYSNEECVVDLSKNIASTYAEIPTVNVCTSEEIKNIEVIDVEIVSAKSIETTWDDIANEFKSSGQKSYSLWLKTNYNVPTKL